MSLGQGEQIVLILVGLVGSGKSTFAEALQSHFANFCRCNQDDLGSRRKVEALAMRSLEKGISVCIDRTNFNDSQRRHFIEIAKSFPNTVIWALIFDTPYEVCASRLETRTNHPTIQSAEVGLSVLERFKADFSLPTPDEGFDRIYSLTPHPTGDYSREDIEKILDAIRHSPPQTDHRRRNMQFFRRVTILVAVCLVTAVAVRRLRGHPP